MRFWILNFGFWIGWLLGLLLVSDLTAQPFTRQIDAFSVFDGEGVWYIAGRQTEWHAVR